MIALFQGIPKMVLLDEPHHGIQFGFTPALGPQKFMLGLRDQNGQQLQSGNNPIQVPVPMRAGSRQVVDVAALWKTITNSGTPGLPPQTGGGSFALQALSPPWSQHFEGTVDHGGMQGSGGFVPVRSIAVRIAQEATQRNFKVLVQTNGNS